MDRLIYTAMSGAKQIFLQQAGVAQNLANANTGAFQTVTTHDFTRGSYRYIKVTYVHCYDHGDYAHITQASCVEATLSD